MKSRNHCWTRSCSKPQSAGFTLMELLVTVGVIALLAAIILPTVTTVIVRGEATQAKSEVQSIAVAVEAYYNEYGKLPISSGHGSADIEYSGASSAEIIEALLGKSGGNVPNPREIPFLKSQSEEVDGTFLDPWGVQYRIKVDRNYNGKLSFPPTTSETLSHRVIVSTYGPDGVLGNALDDDDIASHVLK